VKTQPKERGLPAYLFDAYGLRFYRHMTTAGEVPAEAVWSVIRRPDGLALTLGLTEEAAGYVVAQQMPKPADAMVYPLPVRLGYRAKVAIQALQRLRSEIANATTAADAIAVIDRRINALCHPGA
jgi:hypothetical protein